MEESTEKNPKKRLAVVKRFGKTKKRISFLRPLPGTGAAPKAVTSTPKS